MSNNEEALDGGGIANVGDTATLTLTKSTVSDNTADIDSGIANFDGATLTLLKSKVAP